MLRLPSPLTAAATESVIACLEIAADMAVDCDPPEAWPHVYPLSAEYFTSALARETLLDLVVKLRLPEAYVPTEYHWLLIDECLKVQIEVLNDMPLPFQRPAERCDEEVGMPLVYTVGNDIRLCTSSPLSP